MRKHVILTNGRSGSNHLTNVLNASPHVVNYGEVLGEWTVPARMRKRVGAFPQDPAAYLDWVLSSPVFFMGAQGYSAVSRMARREAPRAKRWSQIETVGIKEFQVNFRRFGLEDYLLQRDVQVINLFRSNALARYVSCLGVEQTGLVVNRNRTHHPPHRVHVPVQDLLGQLEVFADEAERQRRLARGVARERILNIQYEEYFASPEDRARWNARLFDFLQVPRIEVPNGHAKLLPATLEDSLANVDAVRERLRGTTFERFLHAPS